MSFILDTRDHTILGNHVESMESRDLIRYQASPRLRGRPGFEANPTQLDAVDIRALEGDTR